MQTTQNQLADIDSLEKQKDLLESKSNDLSERERTRSVALRAYRRTSNQWLERTPPLLRPSHPGACRFTSSPLDTGLRSLSDASQRKARGRKTGLYAPPSQVLFVSEIHGA